MISSSTRMLLRYFAQALARYWVYVYSLILAACVLNLLLFMIVGESPDGLIGAVLETLRNPQSSTRSSGAAALFVALGPLANVYLLLSAVKSAFEAEDDIRYARVESGVTGMPGRRARGWMVWGMALLFGLLVIPPGIWLYTLQVEWMWGEDRDFWFQDGFWLSLLVVLAAFALIPSVFPRGVEMLGRLESRLSEKVSKYQ